MTPPTAPATGDIIYDSAFGMTALVVDVFELGRGCGRTRCITLLYEDGELGTEWGSTGPEFEIISRRAHHESCHHESCHHESCHHESCTSHCDSL